MLCRRSSRPSAGRRHRGRHARSLVATLGLLMLTAVAEAESWWVVVASSTRADEAAGRAAALAAAGEAVRTISMPVDGVVRHRVVLGPWDDADSARDAAERARTAIRHDAWILRHDGEADAAGTGGMSPSEVFGAAATGDPAAGATATRDAGTQAATAASSAEEPLPVIGLDAIADEPDAGPAAASVDPSAAPDSPRSVVFRDPAAWAAAALRDVGSNTLPPPREAPPGIDFHSLHRTGSGAEGAP